MFINRLLLGILSIALIGGIITPVFAESALYGMAHNGPDGPSTLYSIDKTTGTATPIGLVGFERCYGMDYNPSDGIMYAVCEREDGSDIDILITLDLTSGAGTEVGPTGGSTFGDQVGDISFRNSDNELYAYLEAGDGLGTIDISSGAITTLGATGVTCCGNGIAFSPADILYHASLTFFDPTINLNTLDQILGTATFLADLTNPPEVINDPRISAMDYDPDTGILHGILLANRGTPSEPTYLVTIDTSGGTITTIGQTESKIDAMAFVPMRMVGGDLVQIDNVTLLLSGIQINAIWMIPTIASIAGVGYYLIKYRTNKD